MKDSMADATLPQNPFLARLEQQKKAISANLSSVTHVIAVGSGKGGVGKTFVAINLAWTLSLQGKTVGLLDADIDCPNVFVALGIDAQLEASAEGKILPVMRDGVKIVSMAGLSEDPEKPRVWRGPLIGKAVADFLAKTEWGDLDALIIDLPPGTSDAALTLMQFVDVSGLIVVSTNAPSAVLDAKKFCAMGRDMGKPVLGLVENMRSDMFGREEVEAASAEIGVPFLGAVELDGAAQRALKERRPAIEVSEKLRETFGKITRNAQEHLSTAKTGAR
jgi:ATP-binding protein involved in chromosome partitioning